MTDLDHVIRLVRKLLAKAHGAGTTPEESAAFAAKANELLLTHKLSMSTVQLQQEDEREPVGKGQHIARAGGYKQRQHWIDELAHTIAMVSFCRLIGYGNHNMYTFVGKTSDRELAEFLFTTLTATGYAQGKTWADKTAREHQRRGERVPYRMLAGYLEGFAMAVTTRLVDNYHAARKSGGQHAVVVFEDQRKRVNDWYAEHGPKKIGPELKDRHASSSAIAEGIKAGRAVPLHGGLKPPKTAGRPTITAARRQLGRGS